MKCRRSGGGVEFEAGEDEDGDPVWQWLCSEIEIAARTSNADAVEHGLLVRVHDQQNGRWHEWAMPKRLLAGDGNAYRAELFAMGLEMPLTIKARNAFAQLLMTAHPEAKFRRGKSGSSSCIPRNENSWTANSTDPPACSGPPERARPLSRSIAPSGSRRGAPMRVYSSPHSPTRSPPRWNASSKS